MRKLGQGKIDWMENYFPFSLLSLALVLWTDFSPCSEFGLSGNRPIGLNRQLLSNFSFYLSVNTLITITSKWKAKRENNCIFSNNVLSSAMHYYSPLQRFLYLFNGRENMRRRREEKMKETGKERVRCR